MQALLTTARRFSTWKAATAKALATEDRRAQGGSGSVSPPPPKTLLNAQLTNNQAQGRPAVGVLQEQRHHLDGVHQDAVPGGGEMKA